MEAGQEKSERADAFGIHAVNVAAGILALSPLPGAGGDYRGDLQLIHDWRPGLVISMTTEAEQAPAGGRTLGIDIQSLASRWIHLPVLDFGTPPPGVLAQWPKASLAARKALAGGGRVLVHCRGAAGAPAWWCCG